jgi:hypothetical protein
MGDKLKLYCSFDFNTGISRIALGFAMSSVVFTAWVPFESEREEQFITNRTSHTQDNKNVGRKPVMFLLKIYQKIE